MIHRERDPSLKTYLEQVGLATLGYDPGEADNWWGSKTETAYRNFLVSKDSKDAWHLVKATSFADPVDITAFKKCKAQGKSDQECFKVGDNGVGCWGDDLTVEKSYCALPPEDMEDKWGSINAARNKTVIVKIEDVWDACILADRMPHKENIKNGAGIDLNYWAVLRLGQAPPLFIDAQWRWA